MFRREMCTGRVGIEARRNGLAARREEQRAKLLQSRRNVTSGSSEKKAPLPKPKESAAERRARLNQYREMKTRKESELRTERLKTPAFKVGAAPVKQRTTPSTARKALNFDFKKTSESEPSTTSKTPAPRKAFQLANPLAKATTLKKPARKALSMESIPRTAVKPNLHARTAPEKGVSQTPQAPRTAPKTPSLTQRKQTPSSTTSRGQATPKIGTKAPTPSRTMSNRVTPSKVGPNSASKKPLTVPSSASESVVVPMSLRTPRMPLSSRQQTSTKRTTPSGLSARPTPTKSSTTPLSSVAPKPTPLREKTTPKRTPLASRTRLNLLKQKTERSDATTEEKKSNVTPSKQPTTSLRRVQSTNNLSRPTSSQSARKPDPESRVKNSQPATTLKRTQSTDNLSRPSPLKSVSKPGPSVSQSKTPQMKLQRSTSASTLTRKALTSPSPQAKPRLNLSKRFAGDFKLTNGQPQSDVPPKQKLNTRSHSTLNSVSKPGVMSRIQAAVLKNKAKAEAQKQNPVCTNAENDKKWADLMALIQAQKDS